MLTKWPASKASVPLPHIASQPVQVDSEPQLVWVKLKGFPLWPARVTEVLAGNVVRLLIFDKKHTVVDVDMSDTKPFCKREDLEKKIIIPAKHKSDWSNGYDKCLNIFMELSM